MTFDYWGDAVNIASRMESSGVAGRVQVSEAVFLRLNGRFALQEKRSLNLKGKGELDCYVLAGPASEKKMDHLNSSTEEAQK